MERNEKVCLGPISDIRGDEHCPFMQDCSRGEGPANACTADGVMTDEEAGSALREYEELEDAIREFEDERGWVAEKLQAWLEQRGSGTVTLQGRERTRTLALVRAQPRTSDHAAMVMEQGSRGLRVS